MEDLINNRISEQKTLERNQQVIVLLDTRERCVEVAERMRLVLHGGSAVRSVLLQEEDETNITDLDLLSASFTEKKTSHAFKNLLEKRGISNLRCHPAQHGGTYTVRKDNIVIADITRIDEEDMMRLGKVSAFEKRALNIFKSIPNDKSAGRLRAVPVTYMKLSMHLELSRPAVFIQRWLKVVPRLVALYTRFPKSGSFEIPSNGVDECHAATVLDACRENSDTFTVIGAAAADAILMNGGKDSPPGIEDIHVPDLKDATDKFPDAWEWVARNKTMFCGTVMLGKAPGSNKHAVRLIQGVKNVSRNVRASDGVAFGTSDLVLQYMYAEMMMNGGGCSYPKLLDDLVDFQMARGLDPGGKEQALGKRLVPAFK